MTIYFHTKNLNKRLYRRIIENVVANFGVNIGLFLEEWTIHINDLESTKSAFFQHYKTTTGQKINPNMASGVTGKFEIQFFLHDVSNNLFYDRENSDRIQHELCHAMLFGTSNFVSGVHNTEEKFKIEFWYWKKFFWSKFHVWVIDIRGFLK